MIAIFGLGNYGKRYALNRHNIGYRIVDELARICGVRFRKNINFAAFISIAEFADKKTLFVKPLTFMNNSGVCARIIVEKFQIMPRDILVICDDISLPFGSLRFREKGSCAGQRGLGSIIDCLGTNCINRLRIGIGKPQNQSDTDLARYVLSDFSYEEEKTLKNVIEQATEACSDWIKRGSGHVMNKYNQTKK